MMLAFLPLSRVGAAAALLVVAALASQAMAQTKRYRNPIIFQRAHLDEKTGEPALRGKLWLMEEDGSGLRQLTSGTTYDEHASLYSDQEHVLYSEFPVNRLDHRADARLIKLNIYTGEREVVAHQPGCALHHATVSPRGDRLAYHHECGKRRAQWVGWGAGSYEVNMEATNGVALPDGIIFMHEKNRGHAPREVSLVRLIGHGPGAKAVFVTDDEHLHRRPALAPDGDWMAWQTNAAGSEDEIFLARIDGTNPRNLTNSKGNDGHPWFSRDGKWIVFESDRTGHWEIWRINLETSEQQQLTFGERKYISTRARM